VALTVVGVLLNYLVFRVQHLLPGNPDHLRGVSPPLAFNTAVSFVTNTDWQNYTGESTLSQFSQMFALVVHQFLSAATGMALAAAFIRSVIRTRTTTLGNFWVDVVRSLVRVLVPLSFVFAIVLLGGAEPRPDESQQDCHCRQQHRHQRQRPQPPARTYTA
jgi:potassium-transporting ATPase potassium-binding subunit